MAFTLTGKNIISPPRSASATDCPSRHHGTGLTPLALPQIGSRNDSPASSPACPQPPGLLPRTVAPPPSGASASTGMEVSWEARISRQAPCLGNTRVSDPGSGFQAPQELPPLRDSRTMSPIASRGDVDFLCDPLRGDLKTPGGCLPLRSPHVRQAAGRVSQMDVRTESDDRGSAQDVDHLKRQVTRLTQLRRERDNYIQDLLTEAEATQRRHETEIGRHTMRTQREALERLSNQQREHDLHLEERSRAHAAALAQQAWQHEKEIEELRKALRVDGERRQAEKLTESANHHREIVLRLQLGVEDLRQRLRSHLAALGESALGEDEPLLQSKESGATAESVSGTAASGNSRCGRPRQQRSTTTLANSEPEPEEADAGLAPQSPAEEEAMAERALFEVAEGVERSITLIRKDLECVLLAGTLVAEHAAATHKSQLQEKSHLDRERRMLRLKTQEFASVVATSSSQALLLKVLHAWSKDVRRQSFLEAEQQRDRAAAAQQEKLATARSQAESLQNRLSGELKAQGLRLGRVHMGFLKRLMLFRWAVATREARKEALHRRQLITAAADASAEVYKLRADAKKVSVELRKQRRAHGVAAIHANLDRRLQSVLLAWGAVIREGQREASYQRQLDIAAAESAAGCAVLRMEGRRTALELRERRRHQALRAVDTDLRYWQHLTLREWSAQTALARQEARRVNDLREQAADCEARISASLSTAATEAEAHLHRAEMQRVADVRAQEVCSEAQASENTRLCAEREALQAQIEKLHDELRRLHNQP